MVRAGGLYPSGRWFKPSRAYPLWSRVHPDLVAVSNLWQIDAASDRLRAEHEGLTAAVRAADAGLRTADAALVAAKSAREAITLRVRANDRELADYAEKRDRTRKMIDGGTAPDYAAAERQLAQCLAIVDRLETTALELMDEVSAADGAVGAAQKEVATFTAALASARAALGARDAAIRTELAALIQAREPVAKELPVDYRGSYAQQRLRKRPALVNTKEAICQQCHTKIPTQRIVETTLATAVHSCPGCGGWLLPQARDVPGA